MLRRSLIPLAMAVTVCSVAPAWSQRGPGRGAAPDLPDGPGKDLVQTTCTKCHGLNQITGSWGYTKQGWENLFSTMVAVPKDQSPILAEYLAKNFPEKPRPKAVVIPGSVSVSIKEWLVPSLGSRPHDPLATPDGQIWWTGQWANVLGRLDPKTGAVKEFPLKTPQSGPHGLVADKAGNIWYTGNSKALIGRLDPKNGDIVEFPMPDPAARDPHTPIFDQQGNLWFSVQQANMVGRLTPGTNQI